MRKVRIFNENWRFCKTDMVPRSLPEDWERVTLPHTWNAQDGQDGGNDYWRGTAIYAKSFPMPTHTRGERIFLELNGAAMRADVILNGVPLAHHDGGYATFRVDLTDVLQENNLLCIAVDNGENDCVYPQKADFTFYGGLYRDVKLIIVPEKHFELIQDGTPGIRVTPAVDLEKKRATVTVQTWHNGDAVDITLGDETKRGKDSVQFIIENVHLWDGLEDPFLYTVTARLDSGDEISTRFGCRVYSVDPNKGFFLNGRSYPLRGVCRHQDRAAIGNALTMEHHQEDMAFIREIGANTVRLAHYQQAQEFYDLCDENGVIVWAEIPYISEHMPNGRENTLSQMRELITQCYNHPSIICWGLSNEITAASPVTEDLLENHRLLNQLCHEMDSTRLTTMAHVFTLDTASPLTQIADIGSYNLYYGWYMGECEQNDDFFQEYHARFPQRAIGLSEYGADANPTFQTDAPDKGDYSEQYQAWYHEQIYASVERHPEIWASHLWNLFDFAADGRNEGGNNGVNQKGLVTMDRKMRKDAFYYYKAAWSKEPFVHLCGSRYIDRAEEVTEVKVYSNCHTMELYCDETLIGCQQGERIFVFQVPLSGEHRITAVSGAYTDSITVRKVFSPNMDYVFAKAGQVTNWFMADDFREGYYSIRDTFGALQKDPRTAAVINQMMDRMVASRGDVAKKAMKNPLMKLMLAKTSLESLIKQAGNIVKPEQAREINALLQNIPKQDKGD